MSKIEKLKKLSAAGTPGPWHLTFEEEDSYASLFMHKDKSVDMTIADMNLIDNMRNHFDALLEIVEAAFPLTEESWPDGETPEFYRRGLRKALKKLEERK